MLSWEYCRKYVQVSTLSLLICSHKTLDIQGGSQSHAHLSSGRIILNRNNLQHKVGQMLQKAKNLD